MVFKSLMKSFKNHLTDVAWMDEATRATALDKADAVVHKIGYPDFVVNPALLDERYQQVPFDYLSATDRIVFV